MKSTVVMEDKSRAMLVDRDGRAYQDILRIPKVELHLHFEGSLSPRTMLRLAKKYSLPIQGCSEDQIRGLYSYKTFRDFANVLMYSVGMLRHPDDFFDAMMDLGEQLIDDNVRYAEVTWTPQLYLRKPFSIDRVLEALNRARIRLEEESGLTIRWIPDLVRSYPSPSVAMVKWVCQKYSDDAGIVALGLGGPEPNCPASNFASAFAVARDHGLPINPHAGETAGPNSVWETLLCTQPRRIGHGVRSLEDPLLLTFLARNSIVLEICLTSNLRLGVCSSISEHPIREFMRIGIPVVLNTDDRAMFLTTLSDEYFIGHSLLGLSIHQLRSMAINAVEYSYLAPNEKMHLASRMC